MKRGDYPAADRPAVLAPLFGREGSYQIDQIKATQHHHLASPVGPELRSARTSASSSGAIFFLLRFAIVIELRVRWSLKSDSTSALVQEFSGRNSRQQLYAGLCR